SFPFIRFPRCFRKQTLILFSISVVSSSVFGGGTGCFTGVLCPRCQWASPFLAMLCIVIAIRLHFLANWANRYSFCRHAYIAIGFGAVIQIDYRLNLIMSG